MGLDSTDGKGKYFDIIFESMEDFGVVFWRALNGCPLGRSTDNNYRLSLLFVNGEDWILSGSKTFRCVEDKVVVKKLPMWIQTR